MKKIIYILAIAAAVISVSCSRDTFFYGDESSAEGCVSFDISFDAVTRTDYTAYPYSVCKILIKDTEHDNTIVRKYTDIHDLPDDLWLVEGRYRIEVYLGEKALQSWDKPYYCGAADFAIVRNTTTPAVTVRCTLYSTVIKVVFADSIEDNFEENGYRTDVMIGKTFNADSADKLTYTKTESGYFNFPDGQNAISFKFNGKLKTGETKEVVFTQDDFEIKPEELHGYRHTLTFKYTVVNPDDGYITLKVKTEKEKTIDTSVGINPDKIVSEGTQDIGTAKLASSLWSGSVKLSAYTTAEEGSDIKIEYRIADVTTRAEEGWIPLETQKDEAEGENYYSANLTLAPSTVYEYRMTVNGEPAGDVQSVETPVAPQIPNGGFEEWYDESSKYKSPSKDKASKWWHTGNGGSTTLPGDYWITQPSSDVRTDANGTTSAYMRAKKVAGMLASGNIFIGNFLGTIGMEGGAVAFGREFPYSYKPKKLRFWVKANAGNDDSNTLYVILGKMNGPHVVNTTTKGPSFIDFTQNSETITYCDGKTADNATKPSSKQDPNNAEGKIIAWGSWDNSGSIAEWTMVELDLTYNTGEGYDGVMPNYLIINATTCKRGDYFEGSTDSWMYLDDVEFVY